MGELKKCSRCKEVKPTTEFTKKGDGLRGYCKGCAHDYYLRTRPHQLDVRQQYRSEHPDRIRDSRQRYYYKNRDRLLTEQRDRYAQNPLAKRQKNKAWAERNREKIKAYSHAHYLRNKENIRRRTKEFCRNHRDELNRKARLRYKQNPQRAADVNRKWRAKNRDKVSEWYRDYHARRRSASVVERVVLSELTRRHGSRCYLCDRMLGSKHVTIDHVIPLIRGGEHSYRNCRPCCRSCNSRKGHRLWSELSTLYPAMADRLKLALEAAMLE